jgi:excisionase family DNA binding protein
MKINQDFITVEELAEALRVSPRTVQRFIQRREIPAIRIGRQWRFRREWIDQWINENTVNLKKDLSA